VKVISCLTSGFFVTVIALSLLAAYRFVNLQSSIILLSFNVLFATLAFQLRCEFNRKLGLLSLGNLMGFIWNFMFNTLALAGVASLGNIFETLYIITYPFLNSLWMVSFWSVSLSFLHPSEFG
jgi:hypothetical protein